MISEKTFRIACEHVRWCKLAGLSARQIIAEFGPKNLRLPFSITWDDAVWAVAQTFHKLPRECVPERLAA